MEVTYQLIRKDIADFEIGYFLKFPVSYLFAFLLFFILNAVILSGIHLNILTTMISSFVLVGPELFLLKYSGYRKLVKMKNFFDIPTTFAFDDYGIRYSAEKGSTQLPWQKIKQVYRIPGFIVTTTTQSLSYLIPERAFTSKEASDTFFTSLHSLWEEKKGLTNIENQVQDSGESMKSAPVSAETAEKDEKNLHVPIRHLEYTLKQQDFVDFCFRTHLYRTMPFLINSFIIISVLFIFLYLEGYFSSPSFDLKIFLVVAIPLIVLNIIGFRFVQIYMYAIALGTGRLNRHTIDFDETGLTIRSENLTDTIRWEQFTKIERKVDFIALFMSEDAFILIPPSAFTSVVETNEFQEFVKTTWKKANEGEKLEIESKILV